MYHILKSNQSIKSSRVPGPQALAIHSVNRTEYSAILWHIRLKKAERIHILIHKMPLNHVGLSVPRSKFEQTVSFYLSALAPLGYKEHARPVPHVVGLGVMYPDFWIATSSETEQEEEEGASKQKEWAPVHVAFTAGSTCFFFLHLRLNLSVKHIWDDTGL